VDEALETVVPGEAGLAPGFTGFEVTFLDLVLLGLLTGFEGSELSTLHYFKGVADVLGSVMVACGDIGLRVIERGLSGEEGTGEDEGGRDAGKDSHWGRKGGCML